jgi:putative ABC transport system substrate-binding protein
MRRREFTVLVGGTAAWPFAARAQQVGMPVIGFLNSGSTEQFTRLLRAFHNGLEEAGFVAGQNVSIEYRWADNERDRLRPMADDLVRRQVRVIAATGGSPSALAAKAATSIIPIVFAIGVDPVQVGLVSSLNRPGGNVTGATMLAVDLGSKRLELLREVIPGARVIAALVNPTSPGAAIVLKDLQATADALGLEVHILNAASEREFETVFSDLSKLRAQGLVIGADPLFNNQSQQLAALAMRHAVPAIYQFHEFTEAGGLMSYGGSIADAYRQAGVYTGRVIKGERPADLPVQQSTKVELILNLKTAKALGIEIRPTVLARADEVIE